LWHSNRGLIVVQQYDWHATILHLLGLDYQQLVFDQSGLKEKLTSVYEARIVREILG